MDKSTGIYYACTVTILFLDYFNKLQLKLEYVYLSCVCWIGLGRLRLDSWT